MRISFAKSIVRISAAGSIVLAILGLSAPQAAAQATDGGRLSLEDCPLGESGRMARCGSYSVYEDREAMSGRQIALNLVVVPAKGPDAAPDPVFFLAGGPGQGAAALAPVIDFVVPGINERRDIVLIDQRGTGRSNGLECPPGDLSTTLKALAFWLPEDGLAECREGLDADLTLYTTPIAMDDLDEVRAALGYERINIFGGSYGTRAALVYARRHPEHVRSLILRGVAAPDFRLPLYFARDAQAAMDDLIGDCKADRACNTAFPDFRQKLDQLLAKLEATPAIVRTVDPRTQEEVEVVIDRDVFAGGIRLVLYGSELAANIPVAVERGLEGDFQPFLQATLPLALQILQNFSFGMFLSVVCTEDIPFYTMDEGRSESEGTFMGATAASNMKAACDGWPRGDLPEGYHDHVTTDAPVLLISGEVDPVTPPGSAASVASHLPNSLHIVIPDAGHIPSFPGCLTRIASEFLDTASVASLDAGCVQDIQRPPFPVPPTDG